MIIRKARATDIDGVWKAFIDFVESEDIYAAESSLIPLRKRKKDFKKSGRTELLREFRERNSLFLVAEIDGEIAGYIRGQVKQSKDPFFVLPVIGSLNALVTRRKFRGRGVASALNAELERWFKQKQCVHIFLEVLTLNPATEIYDVWGYSRVVDKMYKQL